MCNVYVPPRLNLNEEKKHSVTGVRLLFKTGPCPNVFTKKNI